MPKRTRAAASSAPSADAPPPSFADVHLLGVTLDSGAPLFGRADNADLLVLSASRLPAARALCSALGLPATSSEVSRGEHGGASWAVIRAPSASAASRPLRAPLQERGDASRGLHAWLASARAELDSGGGGCGGDARVLQARVDAELAAFDAGAAAAAEEKKTLGARMLADGFTLVTRKTRLESEAPTKDAKKKKDKALNDFYRFQKVSEKTEALKKLREGFAEDGARIKRLAAARTFRPL